MELKLNIGYDQLLTLVKQLPASKIVQLKSDLNKDFIKKKSKEDVSELQAFLLSGPVMSQKQFKEFNENRRRFNQWRAK